MANNRIWLIHKPSKIGIKLGKRMAWGWDDAPEKDELERFYKYLSDVGEGSQDDFILAMEDCSGSSCFDKWCYTERFIDGFRVFNYKDDIIVKIKRLLHETFNIRCRDKAAN